jgi:hypothetical protein
MHGEIVVDPMIHGPMVVGDTPPHGVVADVVVPGAQGVIVEAVLVVGCNVWIVVVV